MTAILFAKDETTNGTPAPKRDREANSRLATAKLDRHHEQEDSRAAHGDQDS
ncbi:MAG TPA: hypothetical protein VFZ10_11760 [Geminicoccaceae bacterium]